MKLSSIFSQKNYRNVISTTVISTTLPSVVEMTACGGNGIYGYKVQLIWTARVDLCNTFYIIIYYNTFYIYIMKLFLFLNVLRGENQEGVSDISPTLQQSQNKTLTIV